jgi:hypothetical protein
LIKRTERSFFYTCAFVLFITKSRIGVSSRVVAVAVTVWSGAEVDELLTETEGEEDAPTVMLSCRFKSLFSCILPTTAEDAGVAGTGVVVAGTGVAAGGVMLGVVEFLAFNKSSLLPVSGS